MPNDNPFYDVYGGNEIITRPDPVPLPSDNSTVETSNTNDNNDIIADSKSIAISKFNDTVSKLRKKIASRSVYSMWIRFKVGRLNIDTSSQNLYGSSANYFLSLENVKNGSGQANSFTVSLAYVPKPGDDADLIDKELAYSDRKCILQYGYDTGIDKLFTEEYTGQILDYNVEIRNGMLLYTITGYSSLVSILENKYTFPTISEPTRPSTLAKSCLEEHLGSLGYTVTVASDVKDLEEKWIRGASDITLFQYINSVLALAKDETQPNTVDLADKITFSYVIDDKESSKNITIIKIDPNQSQDIKIVFNWMDKSDNIVIDFSTEFKGAILLNRNYTENNKSIKYSLDSKGEPVLVEGLENPSGSGDTATQDATIESVTWAEAVQHSYKATLVLLGIPCEIPIGTMIDVVPLIYGKPHHTQGTYMITKITDKLDTQGFTTTLDLVKMNNKGGST